MLCLLFSDLHSLLRQNFPAFGHPLRLYQFEQNEEKDAWGVQAAAAIPAGSFVVEYAGELLIGSKNIKQRQKDYDAMSDKKDEPASVGSFLFEFHFKGKQYAVDATRPGPSEEINARLSAHVHAANPSAAAPAASSSQRIESLGYGIARYVNHSVKPNLIARVINCAKPSDCMDTESDGGSLPSHSPRLCFFATSDIEAGQPLTIHYHDHNEQTVEQNPWLNS